MYQQATDAAPQRPMTPASTAGQDRARLLVDGDRGWSLWRVGALRSAGLPFSRLTVLGAGRELAMQPGAERDSALRAAARRGFDELLADRRLRAALTWQNPEVVHAWVAGYTHARARADAAGEAPPSLHHLRRRQRLITRYAQRYAARNDTIGFFGPIAWARLDGDETRVDGPGGLRRHNVRYEVWAIQAVAGAWAADPSIRPHLPVRLNPSCTVGNAAVHRPHRSDIALEPVERQLIALLGEPADEGWTLDRLFRQSGLAPGELESAVRRLCDESVLQVGFRIPICGEPDRHLARQVAAIPDTAVRDRLTEQLTALTAARTAAEEDITDPETVLRHLDAVDAALTSAAGHAVQPAPGLTPGGRTPVYLDCRGAFEAVIGADLMTDLAVPLAILLDSARWLTGQVGEEAATLLGERYRRLAARRSRVTLADLQFAAADVLAADAGRLTDIVEDFQLRWAQILAGTDSETTEPRVVPVAEARRLADALFPATGRLWAAGRVHSPDLLLRRCRDGASRWVLGELHLGLNTLENRCFLSQADDLAELVAMTRATVPMGRVVPVYPPSATEISSRTYPPTALDPPGHYRYWSYGADDGHPSGVATTPATALVVSERAGELVATCRATGWEAPVLECFGEFLSAQVANLFRLRSPKPYAPRVDLGAVTICRRTWRFHPAEWGVVASHDRDPGHDRLRRRATARGLPRHVFVWAAGEPKPFYVDFDAPPLVENLARVLRRATREITVVEMLPGPDELWLRLPDGTAYTSELRLVAVDPMAGPAPSWRLDTDSAAGTVA
ncbi:lantibiotic dehydratase [Nonomuraea sp. NPDC050786]|uniref:lantibiotic dehydratase n=1 Tax=Nonomuraea sp. NPDC050786 TaxID=3154840 RepID=UPI0033CDFE17